MYNILLCPRAATRSSEANGSYTASPPPPPPRSNSRTLVRQAPPCLATHSAQRAGVKMLLLTHIVPALPSRYFDAAFLDGAKSHFDGPLIIGADGQYYSLPAGSTAIERGNWF